MLILVVRRFSPMGGLGKEFLSVDKPSQADMMQLWPDEEQTFARGIIATPLTLQPFQIPVSKSSSSPLKKHSTTECQTTYSAAGETSTNPITGTY